MTPPETATAHTLLPFLERLANAWLLERAARRQAERGRAETFGVRKIALRPGGATIELSVHAMGGLITAAPKVRLEVIATTPERTELRWELGEGGGLSRLAGRGLSLVPQEKVDEWIRERLGDGVRVHGERVVLEHAALVARFGVGTARA